MFGRRKQDAVLFDQLRAITPAHVEGLFQGERSPHALTQTIAFLSMMCAGHFLTSTAPNMLAVVRTIKRDVLAFEALAFSIYAVREAYKPVAEEIAEDIEDEEDGLEVERSAMSSAFGEAAAACAGLVKRYTGWDTENLLRVRLVNYTGAPSIIGQQGAAEQFRMILLSIGKAKEPVARYGKPSLDLRHTLESMAALQQFASTMPQGYAETLRNIVREFDLA